MNKYGYIYFKNRNKVRVKGSIKKWIKYIVATSAFIIFIPLLGELLRTKAETLF